MATATQDRVAKTVLCSGENGSGRILILNQAFYPDVVATAQYAADLALALAAEGYDVTAVAADRGYDDPGRKFKRHESWRGVRIYRVPLTRFGKGARWRRAVDFASFMAACAARVTCLKSFDVVIALTTPPLISVLAAALVPWRARRLLYWCMDLNPDEAIAAGWLRNNSVTAKLLRLFQRFSMQRAQRVVVLDRFMAERLVRHGIGRERIAVIPPWSYDGVVRFDAGVRAAFREEQGVEGRFVVLYAGNHSPCHPLDTLMHAAERLRDDPRFLFMFVGGGTEYRRLQVEARRRHLPNTRFLPYQPLEKLSAVLSAADLHAVVLGKEFRGIVHPSKIYNILGVGAPVLYIGPAESPIMDIAAPLADHGIEIRHVHHGDPDGVVRHLREAAAKAAPPRYPPPIMFSRHEVVPRILSEVKEAMGPRWAVTS